MLWIPVQALNTTALLVFHAAVILGSWPRAATSHCLMQDATSTSTVKATAETPVASGLQGNPLPTVAEESGFARTASHAEVERFLSRLQGLGSNVQVREIGRTAQDRSIPMVIASDPMVLSRADAVERQIPVVYVQANIHGGEVEGKEAALALLRDLMLGGEKEILKHLVLLVVPDLNPDGNDAFGLAARNRPGQNGPERVGSRANGLGLDLNRDCMKAESPEFRAVLDHVWNEWDPDLCMDLHTTDGSLHGYPLTYAPPLLPLPSPHPGEYVRDRLLPSVRRVMRELHGHETFDYGNFDSQTQPTRWETFEHHPRYVTNYAGARGRMAVLSEAYSHAPFEQRFDATYDFVKSVLQYVVDHAAEVRACNQQHDQRLLRGDALLAGLRFEMASRSEAETVLVMETLEPPEGQRRRIPGDKLIESKLAVFDRFKPVRETPLPAGFVLPEAMTPTVDLLARHGIVVQMLEDAAKASVEIFVPTRIEVSARPFQGHNQANMEGEHKREERELAAGSFYVSCRQPLGFLAFYLLHPESQDGIYAWQLCDPPKEGQAVEVVALKEPLAGVAMSTVRD